jgi:hypothetical protein
MLEQVRKPVPARRLIGAADMVPHLNGDEWAIVVFEHQDPEAIGERQFSDRKKGRGGRRWNGGAAQGREQERAEAKTHPLPAERALRLNLADGAPAIHRENPGQFIDAVQEHSPGCLPPALSAP